MKRTISKTEEPNRISLIDIEKENIEEIKMLSNELNDEEIALIRERYNEKKKLDETAILVKDYLNELKNDLELDNDDNQIQNRRISIESNKINIRTVNTHHLKLYNQKKIPESLTKNENNLFLDNYSDRTKRSKKSKNSDKKSINSLSKESENFLRKKTSGNIFSLKKRLSIQNEENIIYGGRKRSSIRSHNYISFNSMKPNFNFHSSASSTNIRNSLTKGSENEFKKKRSDNFFQFKSAFKRKGSEQKKKRVAFPPLFDFERRASENNINEEDNISFSRRNKFKMSKTIKSLISLKNANFNNKKTFKSSHGKYDLKINDDLDYDSDKNNQILIEQTGISNENLLKLNDLKKEIKNSFIGERPLIFKNVSKKFIVEDYNEIKNKEDDKDIIFIEERYRNLQKKGFVYDSFDDDEIFEDQINVFYLNPDSIYVIFLDFLVCICAFYNILYIPYFLGSNKIFCKSSFFNKENIIGLFIDLIYIWDSILPFFVAFYNFDEVLKTDLQSIAKNYLNEWFFLDLIAAIPFKTIISLFEVKCNNFDFMINPLYHNNLIYLLCLIRFVKVYKVLCKNKFLDIVSNFLNEIRHFSDYLKLYSNIITFLIALHIVANIFIFIGRNNYPNWVIFYNYEDKTYLQLYIISIYYSLETLTTVGYGDIVCTTVMEKVFGLFMECIGIFAYSWVVTSMSNYVKVLHEKTEEYENKCVILENIRQSYPKLSDDLYERIKRYLKYKQDMEKLDKKIVIESLPIGLSNILLYEMYKPIINNFIFFKTFDNIDFIVKVLLNFNPIIADKNDILIKEGDLVEDIIFVKRGRLSLELPLDFNIETATANIDLLKKQISENQTTVKKKGKRFKRFFQKFRRKKNTLSLIENKNGLLQNYKILELRRNEHFGDILMFLNQRSPLNVRVKSKKAELFFLNKNHALKISTNFPSIWKTISRKSLFNYEQIKRYINKIKKIFYGAKNQPKLFKNKTRCSQNSEFSENYDYYNDSELKSIPSFSQLSDELLRDLTIEEREEIKKQKTKKKAKELKVIKEATINESSSYESSSSNNYNNKTSSKNEGISEKSDNELPSVDRKNSENTRFQNFKNINSTIKMTGMTNNNSCDIKNTPFEPEDINDEIYPNETFFAGNSTYESNYNRNSTKELKTRIKNEYKLNNNYYNKNYTYSDIQNVNDIKINISICSTEISFSLYSEYENINELSDYKYSKDINLREKVSKILKEENLDEKEAVLDRSVKYISSESLTNSEKSKNFEINKFKESKSKILSKKSDKINNNLLNNFAVMNNRRRRQSISFFQNNSRFSSFAKMNPDEKNSEASQFKDNKSISKKDYNKKVLPKKKKSLLRTLSKNIERNQLNLNDPDLFYSNYFHSILEKNKKEVESSLKKEEKEFMSKLERKTTLQRMNSINLFKNFESNK